MFCVFRISFRILNLFCVYLSSINSSFKRSLQLNVCLHFDLDERAGDERVNGQLVKLITNVDQKKPWMSFLKTDRIDHFGSLGNV